MPPDSTLGADGLCKVVPGWTRFAAGMSRTWGIWGTVRGAGRRGVAHVSAGHGKFSVLFPLVPKTKSWNVGAHLSMYGLISSYVVYVFAMLLIAACKMWVGVLPAGHSNLPLPILNRLSPANVTLLRATVIILVST